jgi:hypothetical protein
MVYDDKKLMYNLLSGSTAKRSFNDGLAGAFFAVN